MKKSGYDDVEELASFDNEDLQLMREALLKQDIPDGKVNKLVRFLRKGGAGGYDSSTAPGNPEVLREPHHHTSGNIHNPVQVEVGGSASAVVINLAHTE